MKYNGKKVNFSEEAKGQVIIAKHLLGSIELAVKNNNLDCDLMRERFICLCDRLGNCLEHLKSEVINND